MARRRRGFATASTAWRWTSSRSDTGGRWIGGHWLLLRHARAVLSPSWPGVSHACPAWFLPGAVRWCTALISLALTVERRVQCPGGSCRAPAGYCVVSTPAAGAVGAVRRIERRTGACRRKSRLYRQKPSGGADLCATDRRRLAARNRSGDAKPGGAAGGAGCDAGGAFDAVGCQPRSPLRAVRCAVAGDDRPAQPRPEAASGGERLPDRCLLPRPLGALCRLGTLFHHHLRRQDARDL